MSVLLALVRISQSFSSGTSRISFSSVLFDPSQRFFPQAFSPDIIGIPRVPGRHVYSIGNMSYRDFMCRPFWKKWFKEMTANFTMKPAHAIYSSASSYSKIGHIKILRIVPWILAAQCQ